MKVLCWLTIAGLSLPSMLLADDRRADAEQQTEERERPTDAQLLKIKSNVVPAVAGIEAADKGAAILYELAPDQLNQQSARKAVQLARQGVQIATDRVDALNKMRDLSEDARSQADTASTKLKEARMGLQRIDKRIGKQAKLSRTKLEQIRGEAKDLHTHLSDAENAVERVAKAYDIPTDLEFGG